MAHWLDRFIDGKDLRKEELQYLILDPLKTFAYEIKGKNNYDYIWGMVAIVQRTYHRRCVKDVFYVINQTGLNKWEKFKLKFSYLFL